MALSNYSELQASIAGWINRTDQTVQIRDFIALAEARFNRDGRLRVRDAVIQTSFSIADQRTSLPSDFGELINLNHSGYQPPFPLESMTPQQLDDELARWNGAQGPPRYYCIEGGQIEVAPIPNTTYTTDLTYYAKVPALSDSATTNWLLTVAPDIYLVASLIEAWRYVMNQEQVDANEARLNALLNEYSAANARAEAGGAPLIIRGEQFA